MLRLLSKQNNSAFLISRFNRQLSSIAPISAENASKVEESKLQQIINADIKENNPVSGFLRKNIRVLTFVMSFFQNHSRTKK
jgi:hypothetical protein